MTRKKDRALTVSVFRHDPYDPASRPHTQEYRLAETPRMTLFTALTQVREEQDPSLQFDFVCRGAVCGACAMLVNGKPRLACNTRVAELPTRITLLPLPFFKLIRDLSVDTGAWFNQMRQRVESWVHTAESFDPKAQEERMSPQKAQQLYELDGCIECGCCLAACATAMMRSDFIGAAGMLRLGRFAADPRDRRTEADMFELVGNEDGVFGCIGLFACHDFCPKNLPLLTQIAYLRRRLALVSLKPRAKEKSPAAG